MDLLSKSLDTDALMENSISLFTSILVSNPKMLLDIKKYTIRILDILVRDMPIYSSKFFNLLIEPAWRLIVLELNLYCNSIVFNKEMEYTEEEEITMEEENHIYEHGYESDDDEETNRQMKITVLKYAALVALDELSGVVREEAMLTQIARMKMLGTYEAVREKEAKELAAKKASGKKPFTITADMLNQRERFQKDVFKPFNPATMMPDDPRALAADDALSSIRAENRRRAAGLPPDEEKEHTSEDDDSDKETEESLRKARKWDEFKDDNPRGWGNSHGIG